MSGAKSLQSFVMDLIASGCSPKKLQLSKIGPYFLATAFNTDKSEIIAESATCGFSRDRDLAVTKALVEWMERKVARLGCQSGIESCQTETSDGIAAFPTLIENCTVLARENALNEAIERYVWATWWDDPSVAFTMDTINSAHEFKNISADIADIVFESGLTEIKVIRPRFNQLKKQVIILFGFTENGGVFSGGACGSYSETVNIIERAFAEMYRHCQAYKKYEAKVLRPNSFYEKRLIHFGSGAGLSVLQNRLSISGDRTIDLPNLKFDEEIKSPYSALVYAHRCLFQGQPPFVAGKMERLCL